MPNYATTEQIFKTSWAVDYTPGEFEPLPQWHYVRPLKIEEVSLWEEIFYQPGHIGIYASYQPYAEMYIIVYDLFKHKQETTEIFYGKDAATRVSNRAYELGVKLETNPLYVDSRNIWMFKN